MRFLVLLLFAITALSAVDAVVRLPLSVLHKDLLAVMLYHEKANDHLPAYIRWPNAVTFEIEYTYDVDTRQHYLRVNGNFAVKTWLQISRPIGNLYWRNNRFFFKKEVTDCKTETKRSVFTILSSNKEASYVQPIMTERKPYLSIKYFSLDELQPQADAIFNANKEHFSKVLKDDPAMFLATLPGSDGHFLEYIYSNNYNMPMGQDAMVYVLLGTGKPNKLEIKDYVIGLQLLYDESQHRFRIPKDHNANSSPFKSVIGVRMMNAPFFSEVYRTARKLFSLKDLLFATDQAIHISDMDLLQASSRVEPRLVQYTGLGDNSPKIWPTDIKFHVKGIIHTKTANTNTNGELIKECPLIITRQDGLPFTISGITGESVCSTDTKVWVKTS